MAADIAGNLEVNRVNLHQTRPFLFFHQVIWYHLRLALFEHFLHYLFARNRDALTLALMDVESFFFVSLARVLRPLEPFIQVIYGSTVFILTSVLQAKDLPDCPCILFVVKTRIVLKVKHCKLRLRLRATVDGVNCKLLETLA